MGALPGGRPTGPALQAAKVAGGPEVSAAASMAQQSRAASKAGGTKAGGKAGGGAGARRRPITADMPPAEVNAELQARRSAASTPGQPVESPPAGPATTPDPPPAPSASPSPGGGLSMPALTGTGGGFLLGLGAWALGLAYLRGGAPEVRKLLAAKFLNKTN